MSDTYLITGVAGFIGSNLAAHLLATGHNVVGVDNYLTGKKENLDGLDGMAFHEGDIRDGALLQKLCNGVDYVLHHAAMASVPWSMEDPALCHEHNITGTLNVLLAARDNNVKKVVMACTSAAYGNTETMPVHEAMPPQPLSPYAATKVAGELYLKMFSEAYGLGTVGLRYFNVYGQRQDPHSAYAAAIPIFAKKLLAGEAPIVFGDGGQTRDFVYIDDVIAANRKACEAGEEANGEVFNIGTGERVTVNDLCALMGELLDKPIAPTHVAERKGDVRHSVADITKAQRLLDFTPAHDIRMGLSKAVGWYRENL